MKTRLLIFSLIATTTFQLAFSASTPDPDDTGLRNNLRERQEKVGQLSTEEQLKLRVAQQKAMDEPDVKAAQEKRNEAIREFRAKLRAAMIKADPKVQPILEKITAGTNLTW